MHDRPVFKQLKTVSVYLFNVFPMKNQASLVDSTFADKQLLLKYVSNISALNSEIVSVSRSCVRVSYSGSVLEL